MKNTLPSLGLLLVGAMALVRVGGKNLGARRRRKGAGGPPQSVPLSVEERAELRELLAGKEISPGSDARDRSITKV